MAVDAFEMAMVRRVFRGELRDAPGLIRGVAVGDTGRSSAVGAHVAFIVAGLHHHHRAEDELLWPKLRARVPAESAVVARMEAAHHSIAEATARVWDMLPAWVRAPAAPGTEMLAAAVEELSSRVDEHLTDEVCGRTLDQQARDGAGVAGGHGQGCSVHVPPKREAGAGPRPNGARRRVR